MMPDPLPCVTWLLLLAVPPLFLARSRRAFAAAGAVSAGVLALLFLVVFVPGWVLMAQARRGRPEAQYDLARWTENHSERMNRRLLWPFPPDVLGGYAWLEKAAAQDHPPAVWLVGVRLKHGLHVPRPAGWAGAAGNHFPQPERGQALIDKAVRLGFRPPVAEAEEERYYWRVYRR